MMQRRRWMPPSRTFTFYIVSRHIFEMQMRAVLSSATLIESLCDLAIVRLQNIRPGEWNKKWRSPKAPPPCWVMGNANGIRLRHSSQHSARKSVFLGLRVPKREFRKIMEPCFRVLNSACISRSTTKGTKAHEGKRSRPCGHFRSYTFEPRVLTSSRRGNSCVFIGRDGE